MRKVVVSNLVSLDGFMAGPNGEIDWFVVNEEFFEYANDLLNNVGTILFGRVTYQGMASYWPNVTADESSMADRMNQLPKVVFSKTLDKVEWGKWNTAHLAKGDIAEEIQKLKQQPGKDMVIYGSGRIVSALTQLGLIDEYHLIVIPVVLGGGKPMFEGIAKPVKLRLLHTKAFQNGTMVLTYTLPGK